MLRNLRDGTHVKLAPKQNNKEWKMQKERTGLLYSLFAPLPAQLLLNNKIDESGRN